jgi:hypothetical protein
LRTLAVTTEVDPHGREKLVPPRKSFIYRFYAGFRSKSFIYRIYAKQPGGRGSMVKKTTLRAVLVLAATSIFFSRAQTTSRAAALAQASNSDNFYRIQIVKLAAPELRYAILARYGHVFFCDPDVYPVAHPDTSQALQAFPEIQKDIDTFHAITKNYRIEKKTDFSNVEKLTVYREYKKLSAIHLEALGEKYKFNIRVRNDAAGPNVRNNGFAIDGLIDQKRQVTVLKKEPTYLTCPL